MNEQINWAVHPLILGYYSATKRSELHATGQFQNVTYYMILFIWRSPKDKATGIENRWVVARIRGRKRVGCESMSEFGAGDRSVMYIDHHKLNACVPPTKFIYWSSNPQCDGIWRWSLWEVIRFRWGHESGTPRMGLVPLLEKKETPELPLCGM